MVGRLVTIDVLPDDVLLLIFSFYRRLSVPWHHDLPLLVYWKWHRLAHVCRRWRRVIFASPYHLKLRLVIPRRRYTTTFECWPPFPISIASSVDWADNLSLEDANDIVTALKHSDRIHEVDLDISPSMLAKSTAWVENSFPALEILHLRSPYEPTVLPSAFLMGGSDGPPRRLREIGLSNVSIPRCLLRPNRDLVSLYLCLKHSDGAGLLSAEALSVALSETHRLESLSVQSYHISSYYPDQESAQQSSLTNTRVILRALATFKFGGPCEYLEDLVSRIDAPILRQLVASFRQSVFDVPQLSQFISRTNHLNSLPRRTSINFLDMGFNIQHHFIPMELPPPRKALSLTLWISHRRVVSDWASQVLHICGQSSPFTSSVEQLCIDIGTIFYPYEDAEQWLQLLGAFKSVQDLRLWCILWSRAPAALMERALEESTKREMAQEVLPMLRILRMDKTRAHESDTHGISAFVDARRRTGRPLVVHEGPRSSRVDEFSDSD